MDRKYNLIDLNFSRFSQEEKRYSLMVLDIIMKRIHEKGFMITSFDPKSIYFEDGEFFFEKIERLSPINSNDKNDAVLNNIIGLSTLAFCSYLPSYDLKNGLLNNSAISEQFNNFRTLFYSVDADYYKSVLVDGFREHKLPDVPYYYDFVKANEKNTGSSKGSSLVKATEFGKLMTEKENQEAAFGNMIFLVCLVASIIVLLAGGILYFINL